LFTFRESSVAAAIGGKQERVMCVRACAIGVRLPSPRILIGYVYINSKIVLLTAMIIVAFLPFG